MVREGGAERGRGPMTVCVCVLHCLPVHKYLNIYLHADLTADPVMGIVLEARACCTVHGV
jgi:hypothetical protein